MTCAQKLSRVLADLIAQLHAHATSDSSPLELEAINSDLRSLRSALDSADVPPPSPTLIAGWSLIWHLLPKAGAKAEVQKALKNALAAVVGAVGEVVVKARAVAAVTPGAHSVVGEWEKLMLALWDGMNKMVLAYDSPSAERIWRDLQCDSISVAMVKQFKDPNASLAMRLKVGKRLLKEVNGYGEVKERFKQAIPSSASLAPVVANASDVELARLALDLAFDLRTLETKKVWGEELFPAELHGTHACLLRVQFGEFNRLGFNEGRNALLKLIARADVARAQALDALTLHMFPLAKPAKVLTHHASEVMVPCGDSGTAPQLEWHINRDSITIPSRLTRRNYEHEPSVVIPLSTVTKLELLSNSVTEEFCCKLTLDRAPLSEGKPLKPQKLGSQKGKTWTVLSDTDEFAFDNEPWVVMLICKIDEVLIDIGAVLDERTKLYPNLQRVPSIQRAHGGASETFRKFIASLKPVQVDLTDEKRAPVTGPAPAEMRTPLKRAASTADPWRAPKAARIVERAPSVRTVKAKVGWLRAGHEDSGYDTE